jgi:hypothetical protein
MHNILTAHNYCNTYVINTLELKNLEEFERIVTWDNISLTLNNWRSDTILYSIYEFEQFSSEKFD